jgi:hypothetical protein
MAAQNVTQPFPDYETWMNDQVTQSMIEDQRRFAPAPTPTKHYPDETGKILLGERAIADAQRAIDDEKGLVWLAMNRGR